MAALLSVNPATGEVVKRFEEASVKDALKSLAELKKGRNEWHVRGIEERASLLKALERILLKNRKEYSEIITAEMGKPITQAAAEIDKCARLCAYYSEKGPGFLRNEEVETENRRSYVRYDPIGTVLAIMPWNFPFWQLFRVAVPSLLAGNAVALKHASNVPQCALKIAEAFMEAGFPDNVFKTLLISSDHAASLIKSDMIDGISLTGSNQAGSFVGGLAGKHVKKIVLELGGSDPFIVLPDCDIENACRNAVKARMVNSGQSCIAAKRFIVHENVAGEFTERIFEIMKGLKVGDPMDKDTDIGPLATEQIRSGIARQIKSSVEKGAKLLLGGEAVEGRGFFFEPTLMGNIKPDMQACSEELFGPVLPVITVKSEEDAVRIANDTEFGLGASIWTSDTGKAEKLAGRIEAGQVFINSVVASDPRLPFGGIKKSGIGRELGKWGIREFVNVKSVVVR